ncbi:ABC transporter permease [Paraclostridium bifermentans]|uniref:ABC transporter permease n=1 Tax=Paraclostridium bifermentans TaxID=1490 RepID=UPI00359CA5C5
MYSNEVFKQLAKNNVKSSIRDYSVYFVTLVFGVVLLYTFNSIGDNFNFLKGNYLFESYLGMAKGIMIVFSVVISIIFGFLINYANNFLMRRRKREFGIYITLGMEKKDINKLMFKEALIVGIFSLITGTILGILLSQGLSIITFKMLNLDENMFRFSISISAIIKTTAFFTLVIILVNIFNKRSIKKYTLVDLLNSHKKNETFNSKGKSSKKKFFILSILLIVLGYAIVLNLHFSLKIVILSLILITLGTFLLFISISDFIISRIKKHKYIYYKRLNVFIVNQIASKIKTTSLSVTTICLVLAVSAIIMPFGMAMGKYIIQDVNKIAPYDVTINEYGNVKSTNSIKENLLNNGFPLDKIASSSSELNLYNLDDKNIGNIKDYSNSGIYAIKESDFNSARSMQGLSTISLGDNEFIMNIVSDKTREEYKNYLEKDNNYIEINDTKLLLNKEDVYATQYYTSVVLPENLTVVIPDEVAEGLVADFTCLNINYIKENNEYDNMFIDEFFKYTEKNHENYYDYDTKVVVQGEKIAMNTVFSFSAIYLGIILLISAGAVLALQQLSETSTMKERMNLLKNIGVDKKDLKKSMFVYITIMFAMPLILASMHSIFLSTYLYDILGELKSVGLLKNMIISTVIIIVVYGIYYSVSLNDSLNIINKDK